MLSPSDIQSVIHDITDIYSQVESECISAIVKRLNAGSKVMETSVWQMRKMSEAGALSRDLVRRLSNVLPMTEKQIIDVLTASLKQSRYTDLKTAKKVSAQLKIDGVVDVSAEGFQRVLRSASAGIHDILNMTGTQAIQASVRTYTDAINNAYLRTISGNYTLEDSVRKATGAIGKSGIKIVEKKEQIVDTELLNTNGELQTTYMSTQGLRTYPLDSAIRRDIVTSINRACGELTLADGDLLETDLVLTSWHIGARPEHEAWQGKVFTRNPNDKRYPNFYDVCGYGEVDGICGINCRHSFMPYFEGTSINLDNKPTAEENNRIYDLLQQQRGFERNLRAMKRQQVAFREGGHMEDAKRIQSRINSYSQSYRNFLDQNNLVRESMLERVEGYRPIGTKK